MRQQVMQALLMAAGLGATMTGKAAEAQTAPPKVPFDRVTTGGVRQALEYALTNKSSSQIEPLQSQGITLVPSGVDYQKPAKSGDKATLQVPYQGPAERTAAQELAMSQLVDDAVGQHLLEGKGKFSERVTYTFVPPPRPGGSGPVGPNGVSPPLPSKSICGSPQGTFYASAQFFTHVSEQPAPVLPVVNTPVELSAEMAFGRGYELYWGGHYSEALLWFDAAISRERSDARFWYYKGLSEAALGDTPRAEMSFEKGAVFARRSAPDARVVGRALERVQGQQRVWLETVVARPRPSEVLTQIRH